MFEPDGEIDYSTLSRAQLEEALANIDKAQYPRNHQSLLRELSQRSPTAYQPPKTSEAPPVRWSKGLTAVVFGALLAMLFVLRIGPDTTISLSPAFGVGMPVLTACFVLGFCWRWFKKVRTGKGPQTFGRVVVVLIWSLGMAGGLGLFVRDSMRTLAAALGGETRSVSAVVDGTRASIRRRNSCRERATFELQNAGVVQLCVRHAYTSDLIDSDLAETEDVTLVIKHNLIGDSVVRILRKQPSAQSVPR